MKTLRLSAALILLIALCSCQRSTVLEDQSILIALGYEVKENNKFQVTGTFINAQPDSKNTSRTVSVEADTSKGARQKMNQMLPNKLATGQIRVILLQRDIFRLKMIQEIEVLSRDPFFSDIIKIAIVDGSPEELLNYKYENHSNIAIALNDLLDHNVKTNWTPSMTLHDFTRSRGLNRTDLAIPLLKREDDEVVLKGLTLLNKDEIVGEASPKEGFFIKTLKGADIPYLYEINIKKEEMQHSGMDRYLIEDSKNVRIVFSVTKGKGKIKLVDKKNLKFDTAIDMDIDIQEVSKRYKFIERGAIDALKRQINYEVNKEFQEFLNKLRRLNSDCVGFGEIYRSRVGNSEVVEENWSEMFPETSLHGRINIGVIRTGIIE